MEYENAIEINKITKNYDGFSLGELSFNVPKGTVMGFVGQNGAGKSTTIKSILNIIKPDSGSIKVLGYDSVKDERKYKEDVAVVFDSLPFHENLTARMVNSILKSIYKEWNEEQYLGYLKRFNLPEKKKIGDFSKGMKMKFQIATALSHNAKLLIMDEATSGLDPVVRSEMLDVFMEYMQDPEHTILMSSHITSDLEKIADCVTFIHGGKLILTGYRDEILENHGIIKCEKEYVKEIDDQDIVSVRLSDFGASVMIKNKTACQSKYSGAVMDEASLDDILLFYVRGLKGKEWRL